MALPSDQVERFRRDLDPLIGTDRPLGLAVSGGPDSMALLLLAAAARPGLVSAATVDHGLRAEAASEAAYVAGICAELGVPHAILTIAWDEVPTSAVQERARTARYAELGRWARDLGLGAIATGHHGDDQAETMVMRLNRGAGIKGLAAMRKDAPLPTCPNLRVVRPLLQWRREELAQICSDGGIQPVEDPSNSDGQYERVRVRQALASADWLDAAAVARSGSLLGQADAALEWAVEQEWQRGMRDDADRLTYAHGDAPDEIARRVVRRAVLQLGREGDTDIRGRELDQLLSALRSGGLATLRGVLCSGGETWRFIPAPNRTRRDPKFN